jgi:hypothetical protein
MLQVFQLLRNPYEPARALRPGLPHAAIAARRRAQNAPDKENHLEGLPRLVTGFYCAIAGLYFALPACQFTDNFVLSVI